MQFFLSYFSEGIAFHLEFVWTIWTISSDDSIQDLIHKYLRMKRQRSKTFYVMFIHLDIYSCICECLCFFFIIFAFHWKFCGFTNEMKWNYDHTHIRSFTRSHTNKHMHELFEFLLHSSYPSEYRMPLTLGLTRGCKQFGKNIKWK